ncbi:glycoside hydrolase family 114 protein, partial [Piromyces sp. E2]
DVIDIDLFDVDVKTIRRIHDLDMKVICYFSAGTYEPFRKESKGMLNVEGLVRAKMKDWNENWLDFRLNDIKPFMRDRLDLAKKKGCDGVEFDNIDAFTNVKWKDKLTAQDQLKYNRWLAQEAHSRDLAAGLKNCLELVKELVNDFDFAINEQCPDYNECQDYRPFLREDKAVFAAFYGLVTDK